MPVEHGRLGATSTGEARSEPDSSVSNWGRRPRYVCPMPVWLSDQEYATLRAACAQMLPSGEGTPGAEEAGVADYIDGFLGAFTFDPPRIWAGGPTSGRKGGVAGFAAFHPLSPLDELAWRMRIEGSRGLPEREFNGPVVGLQERYREGLAALGADFTEVDGREQRRRLREDEDFCELLWEHCCEGMYGAPEYGGNRDTVGWALHRLRGRRAATGLQRRRGVAAVTPDAIIIGSGPGGATAAEVLTRAGWSVVIMEKGRNHLLDPDDLTKPAGDYSNDEIKFVSRYFLGPDPLVEPRAFRRSADEGEHTHVGEVNSIPTTVGGGGTHADGKVPRFREEDFRLFSAYGPQEGAAVDDWPLDYDELEPYYAEVERAIGVSGRRAPTRSPPGAPARTRCPRGRRCTARCCRRRRPRRSACIPTRRRPRPTASPTTAVRPATTAASARSSGAPSTPRATR